MAQVIGSRTTAQTATTEARAVRRVDAEISLVEPSEAPLITLFNKMNKREATDNYKFEWIEDDFTARWASNSAAAVSNTTASTLVTVVDASLFVPGDLFAVPRLVTSSTPPEICRVTAVDYTNNVLTVIRDVGGNGVDTIPASGALTLIGCAYEEGAVPPSAKTTAPTTIVGYTQIFKTTVDISGTNAAMKLYGGAERERLHAKKLKEHKIMLNRALLFGKASTSDTAGPSGKPIRTTDGILARISSNKTDASGTLNQKTFEAFSRQSFRYGKNTKILLCSPVIKSAINEWGKSYLQVRPQETVWGVNVQRVTTAHGEWIVTNDWMLENGVAGKNGFGGLAISLDMEQFKYRFLSGNGQNRDTHINMDAIKDGRDAHVDEIFTEAGFQIKQEKYHALLFNVTDYV